MVTMSLGAKERTKERMTRAARRRSFCCSGASVSSVTPRLSVPALSGLFQVRYPWFIAWLLLLTIYVGRGFYRLGAAQAAEQLGVPISSITNLPLTFELLAYMAPPIALLLLKQVVVYAVMYWAAQPLS